MEAKIIKRKETVKTVVYKAVQLYKNNLCNKNLLFVYKSEQNQYKYFEAVFLPKHFKHLTGVKTNDDLQAKDFYERCIDKKLNLDDFELAKDGTTWLKKDVLESMMNIQFVANSVGDYNGCKPRLITNKLAGNMTGCLGFVNEEECPDYYAPNTILKVPTREMVTKSHQLVAVFVKEVKESLYSRMTYIAKGFTYDIFFSDKRIGIMLDTYNMSIECVQRPAKKRRKK